MEGWREGTMMKRKWGELQEVKWWLCLLICKWTGSEVFMSTNQQITQNALSSGLERRCDWGTLDVQPAWGEWCGMSGPLSSRAHCHSRVWRAIVHPITHYLTTPHSTAQLSWDKHNEWHYCKQLGSIKYWNVCIKPLLNKLRRGALTAPMFNLPLIWASQWEGWRHGAGRRNIAAVVVCCLRCSSITHHWAALPSNRVKV